MVWINCQPERCATARAAQPGR